MEFYSVKQVSEMISVNEETVRRWIREGKLEAERGSGRQGSKISDEALKNFLEKNRGLITATAATTLGLSVLGTVGAGAAIGLASPIAAIVAPIGAFIGANLIKKLKDKNQDRKEMKIELMEEQYKLEQKKVQLNSEINRLQNEVNLIDSQIEKLNIIINDIN